MAGTFDVFFSYHTVDHATVTQVAQRLHDRGIRVFLDRWYLAAGQPWPQALERTLASCGAVAVFLGAEGLGPWQQRERDLALDRQGREPGFPVIPVLLSRTDPALGFLKLNTWVDLPAGTADEAALETLTAAIRRQPPGPLALQQIAAVLAEVCPYRGLRPFREEDEPFFFGREVFTETLAATLARQPFVTVVGASGSGKSSVVRAGLIPRLRRGEGGFVWDVVTLVPTDRPLASLAAGLLPLLEPDLSEVDRLAEVNKLAGHLAEGSITLRDAVARVLQKQRGTDRLLLFVDQWEELYTLCPDEQTCRVFATQLLEVAAAGPVKVVLTMRGDFFGRALADRALSDQLQDAVVTIGPMTRGELAETIVKPAEAVGLAFEAGLAETILDDVGKEPGSLPLLEFLLEALWKERRGVLLHYAAYHRLGRVPGAIAHRADEVFECVLTEAERKAAQRLLIRMIRPGEGVEDTRQRAVMPKADPVAEATIRKLADARLVVTERDAASGRETVEVAHEALIRGWQRLHGWVDQNREFLRTRERIAAQARLWEDEGKESDRLLPSGRPLTEGKDLLATHRADVDSDLIGYIEASIAAERWASHLRKLIGSLSFIPVVGIVFGLIAVAWGLYTHKLGGIKLALAGVLGISFGIAFGISFNLFLSSPIAERMITSKLMQSGLDESNSPASPYLFLGLMTLKHLDDQTGLNWLIESIESYKSKRGAYPESLSVVVWDTALAKVSKNLSRVFYYERVGTDHYYLRSVGSDGQAFTPDDVLPAIDVGSASKHGLLIQQTTRMPADQPQN